MMNSKETLDKAYGNVPKEVPGMFIWEDIFSIRPLKYYYITFWRKIFR
jgi:hypothetical protein